MSDDAVLSDSAPQLPAQVMERTTSLGPIGEPPKAPPQLAAAKRLLAGRWKWALGIGGLLAVAGAIAGASLPKPLYKSVGLIDVAPKVGRVLYELDDKGLQPNFDAYVMTQAQLVSQRRVVDMAMDSPEWKRLGRGSGDRQVAEFIDHLQVTHPRYTQHIEISFVDEDPEAASVAVTQVIEAYMRIVRDQEREGGADKLTRLESTQTADNNKLAELRANSLAITEDLGEEAVNARYDFEVKDADKLRTVLHDLDLEIAAGNEAADTKSASDDKADSENEIALKDAQMAQWIMERDKVRRRIKHFEEVDKLGAKHPLLLQAQNELAALDEGITSRAQAFRHSGIGLGSALEDKKVRRARVAAMLDGTMEEIRRLSRKRLLLDNNKAEQALTQEQLLHIKQRIEALTIEKSDGRISVLAVGDRPVEPDTDRRIPFALLGGVGGILVGFASVLLWGVHEARLRNMDDLHVESANGRFLGVVPDVDRPIAEELPGMAAETADYCVHQIRTLLQLRAGGRPAIVALTSPSPGAGKTTLTLAVGMSYATTNSRTLLVDCDFFGRGLTSAMRALVYESTDRALFPPELDGDNGGGSQSLISGVVSGRRVVQDSGRVERMFAEVRARAQKGDVESSRALRSLEGLAKLPPPEEGEDREPRGILAALDGVPLEDCVVDTGFPNLSILPATDVDSDDAAKLSPAAIDRLLAVCRGRYDTVLVDTGPVLGSIEAAFVATAADDVVVVVSRGEKRPLVNHSVERLDRIGAAVAGVVFNRAASADIERSNYASRSHSRVVQAA
jgi:polysaccharide biosynthesis transport protein